MSSFSVVVDPVIVTKTKSGHRLLGKPPAAHLGWRGLGTQQRLLEGEWCARMGAVEGRVFLDRRA